MMTRESKLDKYRDQVGDIFLQNMKTVMASEQWNDAEKAGTLALLAVSVLSSAAFAVGNVEERLKNAPPEAQIDDMLNMLRKILVENKPVSTRLNKAGLTVVEGGAQ